MNVLFVSPVVPWPLTSGGRIRTFQLLRQVQLRGVQVHLRAVRDSAWTPQVDAHLAEHCASVRSFPRSPASALQHVGKAKLERWFHSEPLRGHLREALHGETFDCIHVDELFSTPSLPDELPAPLVVNHHKLDVEFAQATGASAFDLSKLRRLERRIAERTPHHIVCSVEDANRLRGRYPELDVHVVGNGADPEQLPSPASLREPGRMLFLGSLDYEPNIDAVRHFVREVLPSIRAARPDAHFAVAGSRPGEQVRALAGPGVQIIGAVNDASSEFARAAVCVVPLRIGGGSRLKIAEALALGCPLVSTTIGAEGLPVRDGEHLSLADSPDEFAAATLEALERHPDEQVRRGRELAENELTWARMAEDLEGAWRASSPSKNRTNC